MSKLTINHKEFEIQDLEIKVDYDISHYHEKELVFKTGEYSSEKIDSYEDVLTNLLEVIKALDRRVESLEVSDPLQSK